MSDHTTASNPERTTDVLEERSRRRSERVVLRVPVMLSAIMPGCQRICIESHTLVVNAHGGLLDVGIELVRGQTIRLRNSKTEIVTTGRVLRVEMSDEGRFSVAFEFESPSPHFWPVSFPPADWSVHSPNKKKKYDKPTVRKLLVGADEINR
jgi:hypothetical protein